MHFNSFTVTRAGLFPLKKKVGIREVDTQTSRGSFFHRFAVWYAFQKRLESSLSLKCSMIFWRCSAVINPNSCSFWTSAYFMVTSGSERDGLNEFAPRDSHFCELREHEPVSIIPAKTAGYGNE